MLITLDRNHLITITYTNNNSLIIILSVFGLKAQSSKYNYSLIINPRLIKGGSDLVCNSTNDSVGTLAEDVSINANNAAI